MSADRQARGPRLAAIHAAGKGRQEPPLLVIDDPTGPPLTEEQRRRLNDWYQKVIKEGRLQARNRTVSECSGSGELTGERAVHVVCRVCGAWSRVIDRRVAPHPPRKAE